MDQGMEIPFDRQDLSASRARGSRKSAINRRNRESHHPATAEMNYTSDEAEFMMAMDDYKRRTGSRFPTLSETLRVVKSLGYSKLAEIDADDDGIGLDFSVNIKDFGSAMPQVQLGPRDFDVPPIGDELLASMLDNLRRNGADLSQVLD